MPAFLWSSMSRIRRAQFIQMTFHESWKRGARRWRLVKPTKTKCACGALMGSITGSSFALNRCATSRETWSSGTDQLLISRIANKRRKHFEGASGFCGRPNPLVIPVVGNTIWSQAKSSTRTRTCASFSATTVARVRRSRITLKPYIPTTASL